MKSLRETFVFVIFLAIAVAAQPDLKTAPKAVNPENRSIANRAKQAEKKALKADFQQRNAKRIELRLERLPKTLTALGVTDEKTQEVVIEHIRTVLSARTPMLEAQLQLRRALILKITTETQFKTAIEAQRASRKAYEAIFQNALDNLNEKTAYRKTPRLEAALLAIGALDPDGVMNNL